MSRVYLLLGGLIALGLGAMILFAPVRFYAGYGLNLSGQVSLLNELRAHGLSLVAAGLFIASGAVLPPLRPAATLLATVLYLSYGLSRLVAVVADGLPSSGLLLALAAELALGLAGLALVLRGGRALAV